MTSNVQRSTHPSRTRGERSLRLAWISVALVPVAFLGAMLLGEGLLSALGYSGEEDIPLEVVAKAGGPALLLMIAPMLGAVWFGLRARREHVPNSWVPALVGGVLAVATLVTNIGSYVLASLLG